MNKVRAAAKINLDLRVTGRREDGYHLLDSIVAFTEIGDDVEAELSDSLSLEITGPFSQGLSQTNNLILDAARLIGKKADVSPNLKFKLHKNLPISSGIGGGSADAAAALKLCNDLLDLGFDQNVLSEIALQIGADVPVCLRSSATRMCGIGEDITQIELVSDVHVLLVNPGFSVSTPEIFRQFHSTDQKFELKRPEKIDQIHLPLMIDCLKDSTNSLQSAACAINNEIEGVIQLLETMPGVLLSRMSGSGATCFAIFAEEEQCAKAAINLKQQNPNWWVCQTRFID